MLSEAIYQIIGLSILFIVCSLFCYCFCAYLLKEEGKDDRKPPVEVWKAKHYYDPLPSAISPPEILTKPTVYSFKIQNGKTPHALPHAVINPAVLQYPPGHVLEERHISPHHQLYGLQEKGSRNSVQVSPSMEKVSESEMFFDEGIDSKGRRWVSTIA